MQSALVATPKLRPGKNIADVQASMQAMVC